MNNDDILSEATERPVGNDSTDPTEGTAHGDSEPSAATGELVAESNTAQVPQEMDHKCNGRDPETGRFIKGWKGGGRPKGSKDRFSKQVLDTLQACWEENADQMLAQLAAEKPEVIMGMVARLMPQAVITEDITGIADDSSKNNDVTIRVVTQQHQEMLPTREVEGELLPLDNTTH